MNIANALPCPHCGCTKLRIVDWCTDEGEIDAIECQQCIAAAPATIWNVRSTPLTTDQANKLIEIIGPDSIGTRMIANERQEAEALGLSFPTLRRINPDDIEHIDYSNTPLPQEREA